MTEHSSISTKVPHLIGAGVPTPEQMIDALNDVYGVHEGTRASHAKGQWLAGSFLPSEDLRRICRASLFARANLDVVARASVGGGNPNQSDKSRTVRGLSVHISDAVQAYDLVLISEPVFFAATPQSFISFLEARIPDPATKKPNPARIAEHNAKYPDGKVQAALLAAHPAPASYATTPYYSTNAFKFVDSAGVETWARLVAEPVAGTVYLDEKTETALADNFLDQELKQRLKRAPVEFVLKALLPSKTDSLTDSTQLWEGDRLLTLGRLRLTDAVYANSSDGTVFVPTRLPDGIEPSDDPILKARPAAYAAALARRRCR